MSAGKIPLHELVRKLAEKPDHEQNLMVEWIICSDDKLVSMYVEGSAVDMANALKLFGKK